MEVKPAYKQTEVGVIPEDWGVSALKDCCSKITDGTHDTPKPVRSGVPFLTAIHVKDNWIDFEACLYVTEADHAVIYSRCNPKNRDVLMVNIGAGVATTALVDVDYEFSLKNVALLKPDSRTVGAYLNYSLAHRKPKIIQDLSSGGAQPFLSLTQIGAIAIVLPPTKAEQEAIAGALSDADKLIESLEQLIAKKRQLKQGAMQELLTGKKRLPGFSGKWEVKPFDGVLARLNAKTHQIQTSDYQTTGQYPVVDQGKEHVIGFSDRHDKRFRCPESGVIVFGDHTCIVKFIDFDFLVGADGTQILQAKSEQCTRFHGLQLQHRGVEPTGYNRHFKFLKEREFLTPPLPEQTAIAAIFSDMDAEIDALETNLTKARQLKQGMMQELLTGRIRLI